MNALQFAVDKNQEKIVSLIISYFYTKIDINSKSIKAIITGNDIEIYEKTALYISIENKNIKIIKLLLERDNINVNEKSYHCFVNRNLEAKTALHLASELGDFEIIKHLLEKKEIDINIEDHQGKKPIDYSENDEIKKLLSK